MGLFGAHPTSICPLCRGTGVVRAQVGFEGTVPIDGLRPVPSGLDRGTYNAMPPIPNQKKRSPRMDIEPIDVWFDSDQKGRGGDVCLNPGQGAPCARHGVVIAITGTYTWVLSDMGWERYLTTEAYIQQQRSTAPDLMQQIADLERRIFHLENPNYEP